MKKILTLALALLLPNSLGAQTYNQVQWGIDTAASSAASPNIFYKVGTLWRSLTSASTPTSVYIDAFGAVGDGVTDDSTPLINAIASLNSKGGRVVLSCQKNYAISQNINVPGNIEINHCFTPGFYGFTGTGTPSGALLNQAHVNLASTASFTMNGNSGYYGAVFRAGQTYPASSIAGYAGTAFKSAAGFIQDVHINALVVGFATCYDGTNRVDRLHLTMECDANPSATSGAIILGPSFDSSYISARMWPWGTYSATGGPTTRTGYGLYIPNGATQDDSRISVLDFGHDYGVVSGATGNIHWEHVWTDNNIYYGFYNRGGFGGRSIFDAMMLYKGLGARFEVNGSGVSIGTLTCNGVNLANSECLEVTTPAGSDPATISIGNMLATELYNYAINVDTKSRVFVANAKFTNVHTSGGGSGVAPYVVGSAGWTADQVQFANKPVTDLSAGAALFGGNPIDNPSIASAATLALPVDYDKFTVTGTTNITNITGTYGGRIITLTFNSALTLSNSATISLVNGANFVTALGRSISLQYDAAASVWRELWRSPTSLALPTAVGGTVTSGGIPYFDSTTQMSSSALLAQYQLIIGGGAGAAPASLGSTGTAGQQLQSNGAAANPSWTTATYPATAASGTILAAGATNTISATATPTIGTSVTVPLISGGTTASSTLTVQSTSGAGTSDSIVFRTSSQSAALTLDTNGTTVLGTTARNTTLVNARGNLQVTNNFLTTGTSPDNWMVNTGAATDEKTWDYFASGTTAGTGTLSFRALNDAVAAATTWLGVYRTGTTINSIRFGGNVGIGATVASAPSYRLDVSGDTNTSGVYRVGGTAGITATKTVRDAAGTGTCTLIFTGGLLTGGTC